MRVSKKLIDITGMRDIAQRRILMVSANSSVNGPTVWLTACIHGDEVGGTAVVHDVFSALRKNGLQRGTLKSFPLINSMGFENVSRFFNADREDLNRCFLGQGDGTMGQQVAQRLFNMIASSTPDFVIDLHNDWIQSVPYVLLEPAHLYSSEAVYQRTSKLAISTGLLVVEDSDIFDPKHTTLAGALVNAGIPAITIEAGGAYAVAEDCVSATREAVLEALRELGMLNQPKKENSEPCRPIRYQYSNKPLCTKSGLIRFCVQPGDEVIAGQALARVYSAFGSSEETLYAIQPGIVLGLEDHARALPGRAFIAMANCV